MNININEYLENGKWMIRRSDAGKSYGGFLWNPIGQWTEAPDWSNSTECGGGLHGNGPNSSGYYTDGKDVDFCIVEGEVVDLDGEKIKVPRAMIVMRNELPDNLSVGGFIVGL